MNEDKKLWKDLTDADKIDRLNQVIKILITQQNMLNTEIHNLKENNHKYKENGWL